MWKIYFLIPFMNIILELNGKYEQENLTDLKYDSQTNILSFKLNGKPHEATIKDTLSTYVIIINENQIICNSKAQINK